MPITCTIEVSFCAAHRLQKHRGLCRFLHGHNYKIYLTFQRNARLKTLDEDGMVVDFGTAKAVFQNWIDKHWDHSLIFVEGDGLGKAMIDWYADKFPVHTRYYIMQTEPTAENMAHHLLKTVAGDLGYSDEEPVALIRVDVKETDGCLATAAR